MGKQKLGRGNIKGQENINRLRQKWEEEMGRGNEHGQGNIKGRKNINPLRKKLEMNMDVREILRDGKILID